MDTQNKLDIYQKAHAEIKRVYASLELGAKLLKIADEKQVPVQTLSTIIGDVILGLFTTDQLPKLLETELGIDEATALAIVEDLQEFLQPVYDRENGVLPDDASYAEKALADADPTPDLEKATPNWNTDNAAAEPSGASDAEAAAVAATSANSVPSEASDNPAETAPQAEPQDTIAPMRTMEGDMKKIHGYGAYRKEYPTSVSEQEENVTSSSQEATLARERPQLASTPKVDDNESTKDTASSE